MIFYKHQKSIIQNIYTIGFRLRVYRKYLENQANWVSFLKHSVGQNIFLNIVVGKPVIVPKSLEAEATERFTEHEFDIVVSEMISVNRSLTDIRDPK